MRTCRRPEGKHSSQVLLLIISMLMMGGSLKQQLVSASHLHASTNYAHVGAGIVDDDSQPPTPQQQEMMPSSSDTAVSNATVQRRYTSITASCKDKLVISGNFAEPFRGRIYALGYPDESECGFTTAADSVDSENVTFVIPMGQCGVQMRTAEEDEEGKMIHDVTLYIQYSAFLQQVVDEKVSLSCAQKRVKTSSEEVVEPGASSGEAGKRNSRQGRRMKDVGVKSGLPKISNKIGEAWMEILSGKDPTPKSKNHSPVAVGEDITVVISTKINRGYDARIVNCTAHDGSRTGTDGFRAQQLLDSAGCSVDRGLVPNFRRRRLPVENSRLSTLHFATFAAFKFPERDHLHIKCMVAYCQGPCPQETCDSGRNHFGSWREKYGRIAEVLVDNSEVVNSLEILAPELEDNSGGHHYERHQSASSSSSESSGAGGASVGNNMYGGSSRQFSDSQQLFYTSGGNSLNGGQQQSVWANGQIPQAGGPNVCISPGTVILALVILGVVLVISASATLWFALKRSELKKLQMKQAYQHGPNPYYRFSQHW